MKANHYLEEADSYYSIVSGTLKGSKKFGNKLTLNLMSICTEKYLVSYLLSKSIAIQGHSIKSLLSQLEKHSLTLPSEIKNLKKIDERMDLCSLNPINNSIPEDNEMENLIASLGILKDFVYTTIDSKLNKKT